MSSFEFEKKNLIGIERWRILLYNYLFLAHKNKYIYIFFFDIDDDCLSTTLLITIYILHF